MRLTICCLLLLSAGSLLAGEEKFENLQVLPKDISKEDLNKVMKSWTKSLGVRCHFCHVGEKGAPLSTFDFVSDDKGHKEMARKMVKMTRAINNDHMANFKKGGGDKVTCDSCHRGLAHPRTLENQLAKRMDRRGVDAGVAYYHDLRKRFYGRDSFDFGEESLIIVATRLSKKGDHDGALKFLKVNMDFFPDSVDSLFLMGEIYAKKGDKAAAISHFEKVVAKAPKNEEAKRKLEELRH